MKKIHVGFLLSYDYDKLKKSIPPVYDGADRIFIAIDKEQRTWSGQHFEVDKTFFDWLQEMDVDKKITVYHDDFYVANLSAIQNDSRERHMLALKMGIGNWIIQVDSDEFFIDFKKFVQTLRKYDRFLINPEKHPVQIAGYLVNIYKYLDDGLLYVDNPTKVMLATNYPNYKVARKTKERIIYTDNILLHECLSRTEEELRFKFSNWGHNDQINETFFDKWRSATKENYKELRNVFYMNPSVWAKLGYLQTKDVKQIKEIIAADDNLKISKLHLIFKNFGQWFKSLPILKPNHKPAFESYFKATLMSRPFSYSLLISTYNWPEALSLVLKSVSLQSRPPHEILIADDGSGQETKEIIDAFAKKTSVPVRHFWQQDKGFRKAKILNKAIAATASDYLIQIDGDCIIHREFIADHLNSAEEGTYLYGSRVNILPEAVSEVFKNHITGFNLFSKEIKNKSRTLHIPFLSKLYKPHAGISKKYRGCNVSFWRSDFLAVNGYNEDYEGWGREDSDLAIRMGNNGTKAKRLRYAGILYHIHHKVNSKQSYEINDRMQQEVILKKTIRVDNGIDKYLA